MVMVNDGDGDGDCDGDGDDDDDDDEEMMMMLVMMMMVMVMMMHLFSFLLLPSLRIARSSCRCLWLERNLGGKIEPTLIIWKRFRFFKNPHAIKAGCE